MCDLKRGKGGREEWMEGRESFGGGPSGFEGRRTIRSTFSPGRVTSRECRATRRNRPNFSKFASCNLPTAGLLQCRDLFPWEFPGLHRSCVAVRSEIFFDLQLLSILAHSGYKGISDFFLSLNTVSLSLSTCDRERGRPP